MHLLEWGGAALWLGLLTAVSPCPLTANLAAVSFLGRNTRAKRTFVGGLLYATGRSLAYVAVGSLLSWGLVSAPGLSRWLQNTFSPLLGPLLVVTGLMLLGWIPLPTFGGRKDQEAWRVRVERWGLASALPMGFVFALAFCPVSAALFFGSLLPLSVGSGHTVLVPLVYGLGTALPVVGFAMALAWSAESLGSWFARSASFERAMRWITAMALVGLGLYLTWTKIWLPLLQS